MTAVYRQVLGISSNGKLKRRQANEITADPAGDTIPGRQDLQALTTRAAGRLPVAGGKSSVKTFHLVRRSRYEFHEKSIVVRLRAAAQRAAGSAAVPMNIFFGDRCRNSFGILMYHRIAPNIAGIPAATWNVTPEKFRDQMRGLVARGYNPWPLRKVLEYHRKGLPIPPGTFVLTFDDGYECVYTNAWPILKELQIPATVFVVTGLVDTHGPLPCEDWPVVGSNLVPASTWHPLSKEQCRNISADGLVDLGVHTHWHEDYRGRPEAFRRDMALSLQTMQTMFGNKEVAFAFPYGYAGPELTAVAKQSGVTCALTAKKELIRPLTDPFDWGRLNVEQYDSGASLAAKMSGWYGAIYNFFHAFAHFQKTPIHTAVASRRSKEPARQTTIRQ